MKKFFVLACVILASANGARAELSWLTDLDAAKTKAKADHKLVVMNFTGSDWCPYCIALDSEVFSKPRFQEYAARNLVLVELDFPRSKAQSDTVKKQNMRLAQEYDIQGFPTVVVLDPSGKTVGQLGYMPGGVDAFIAALEKLRKS